MKKSRRNRPRGPKARAIARDRSRRGLPKKPYRPRPKTTRVVSAGKLDDYTNRYTKTPGREMTQTTMTECAVLYARALTNPFAQFDHPPCIPDTFAVPSHKFSTRAEFNFSVGQAGVGGVLVFPWAGVSADGIKDAGGGGHFHLAASTTPAYALSTFVLQYPPAGGTLMWQDAATSPYIETDLAGRASDRLYRLVGSAIRVSYIGKTLDKAGTVYTWRSPDNNCYVPDLLGDWIQLPTTTVQGVQEQLEFSVGYYPRKPRDTEYAESQAWATAGGDYNGKGIQQPIAAYAVQVQGGVPLTSWKATVVSWYEMIGRSLPVTKSHSDPQGMGAVISATTTAPNKTQPAEQEKSLLNTVAKTAKDNPLQVISHIPEKIVSEGEKLVGGAVNDMLAIGLSSIGL